MLPFTKLWASLTSGAAKKVWRAALWPCLVYNINSWTNVRKLVYLDYFAFRSKLKMTSDEESIFNLTMMSEVTSASGLSDDLTTTGPFRAEEHPAWLSHMEMMVRVYVIPSLCAIGILFNSTSAIVLFHSELQLRKSLIQLFAFLNTFDWWALPFVYN